MQVLNWKSWTVQVASLRKQKTFEAREEESEEIKHIKKVIHFTYMYSKYGLKCTAPQTRILFWMYHILAQ